LGENCTIFIERIFIDFVFSLGIHPKPYYG